MKWKALSLAGVACTLLAVPALAHHSFAMFDHNVKTIRTGMISGFEWLNPHCWVHLSVTDPATGRTAVWSFEGGSTGQLAQSGWTGNSLKGGEAVDIEFHPLRDGSNGGMLLAVMFHDGRYLCQGPECRGETPRVGGNQQ